MGGLAVDTHELITQLLLFGVIAAGNKFLSELKRRVEASAFLQKREVQAAGVLAVAVNRLGLLKNTFVLPVLYGLPASRSGPLPPPCANTCFRP